VKFDALVVGAGPSGSICASLLARQGLRVGLVVGPRPSRSWLELLSPECILFMRRLGFDSTGFTDSVRLCSGIVDTWNHGVQAISDFELTRCSAGWIVDRNRFDASLVDFARSLGVGVVANEASYRLVSNTMANPVVVESQMTGSRIEAAFILDATGVSSRLMPYSYSRRVWLDRLVAVRIISRAIFPNADWMRLSSSSAGWWYLLPGFDGAHQAVFMTDGDFLPTSASAMRRLLEHQFEDAFGSKPCFEAENDHLKIEIRSARTSCRKTLWSHRWMPLGDAAYSIDPISGGGLARALQMAEQTATAIVGFFSTPTSDELQRLAVERAQEFCQKLDLLRLYYAPIAAQFSNEKHLSFWGRRRKE